MNLSWVGSPVVAPGKIPWRRKWQSTPTLLPGKSHRWRRVIGYSPWGLKESDTTERLHFTSYRWDTSPASLAINHSSSPASLASPSMITAWTWVSLVAQLVKKKSACTAEDLGSIPALGRSPGEGHGNPLQYSCLKNSMDKGAWRATVHGVAKSQTRLSDFTFTFHFHALEKEMATHSSILAWRIPWTEEPGGLQLMGSQRIRHDWALTL